MNLITVLILCCAIVRSSSAWTLSLSKTKELEIAHEAGKEDWEIKARMLYATAIIPTVENKENAVTISVEDEEDGGDVPLSLYKTEAPHQKSNQFLGTHPHKKINKKNKKRMAQQHSDSKNSSKPSHKNKRTKRSSSITSPLYNIFNSGKMNNINKRGLKLEMNKNTSAKYINPNTSQIKTIPQTSNKYAYNQVYYGRKALPHVKALDQSYLNFIKRTQEKYRKIKREDNSNKNFDIENFWETPKCHIIGDGVDHVCIQYSSPTIFNDTNTKSNLTKISPLNRQQDIDEKNIPLQELKGNGLTLNNDSIKLAYQSNNFSDNNYKSRVIETLNNGIQKLDSVSLKGSLNEKVRENSGELSTVLNNMPIQDSNGIMQHWHDLYSYPYTKDNFNVEDSFSKFHSNVISKALQKKRKGVHLPIDITVAMKNLFTEINPIDLSVSNSSRIIPDGSFEFTVQLRDKNAHYKNQYR